MRAWNIGMLLAAALTLLLSGCAFVMPDDPDFQRDWKESWDAAAEDWAEDWDAAAEDWGGELDKACGDLENPGDAKTHQWKILDAQGEELYHITEEASVEALDGLFDGRDRSDDELSWGPRTETAGTPLYTYVFWQEKTLLAGQDPDAPREYEEIIRFTIAEAADTVTIQILNGLGDLPLLPQAELTLEDVLTFQMSVSPETAEALRDPARFAV